MGFRVMVTLLFHCQTMMFLAAVVPYLPLFKYPSINLFCSLLCSFSLFVPFVFRSCFCLLAPFAFFIPSSFFNSISMVECGDSSIQPFQVPKGTTFDGYGWHSAFKKKPLTVIQDEFHIPEGEVMEIPPSGCYNDEGFAGKVTLTRSLLSHVLRLSFCQLLHDILDLLDLAPTQLHSFAFRAYLCFCIIFCMFLELLGDLYPDLIAREFLALYNVKLATKGNVTNFRKKDKR